MVFVDCKGPLRGSWYLDNSGVRFYMLTRLLVKVIAVKLATFLTVFSVTNQDILGFVWYYFQRQCHWCKKLSNFMYRTKLTADKQNDPSPVVCGFFFMVVAILYCIDLLQKESCINKCYREFCSETRFAEVNREIMDLS